MLFNPNKLYEFIHCELSQKCNLACPMCPRESLVKSGFLDKSQIAVEDFKKIFDPIKDNCGKFFLSGNYSDPMMHTDIEDIVDYILDAPNTRLQIGTNMSLRTPDLYYRLGQKMRKHYEKHRRFNSMLMAIDGLEDTNHIYRVNAKWDKVMENARAFIEGGGAAEWKYIVFEHNEHQVEEANQLSKDMGFVTFNKILSMRFVDWFGNVRSDVQDIDNQARREDKKGVINRSKEDVTQYVKQGDDSINCHAIGQNGIFVTDKGLIMPCCWLGNEFGYNIDTDEIIYDDFGLKHIIEKFPNWKQELNAIDNGIENVMQHPIWEELQLMWDLGQPLTCYRHCGKCLDDVKSQTVHI